MKSTVISLDDPICTQKDGICIELAVAPCLAEIYLSVLDCALGSFFSSCTKRAAFVSRFVEDISIVLRETSLATKLEAVTRASSLELFFMVQHPVDRRLKFLDIALKLEKGLCQKYSKIAARPVLPAMRCHLELVKGSLVRSLLFISLMKPCRHFVTTALLN